MKHYPHGHGTPSSMMIKWKGGAEEEKFLSLLAAGLHNLHMIVSSASACFAMLGM
jgi:hypothetical protein